MGVGIFDAAIFDSAIFDVGDVLAVTGGGKHKTQKRRPLRVPGQPDLPSFNPPVLDDGQFNPPVLVGSTLEQQKVAKPTIHVPFTAAPHLEGMTAMAQAMEKALANAKTQILDDEEEALIMLLMH